MREKYILEIKKEMFWCFDTSEIRDMLNSLMQYFHQAMKDGLTEKEAIEQRGTPKEVVEERKKEQSSTRGKNIFLRKKLTFYGSLLFFIALFRIFSLYTAAKVFVVFVAGFLWCFSGNNCLSGVLGMTGKKKKDFVLCQVVNFVLFVLLQLISMKIVPTLPYYVEDTHIIGKYLQPFIYFMLIFLCLLFVVYYRKMQQGNVAMFFSVLQAIALFLDVYLYNDHLHRTPGITGLEFFLWLYIISLMITVLFQIRFIWKKHGKWREK